MKLSQCILIASLLGGLSTTVIAKSFDYDIHLGISSYDGHAEYKGTNFNLGYGVTKIFDNNVLFGVTVDSEYTSIKEKEIYSLSGDLRVGYNVLKKLNVYAIGGYKIETMEDITGYGFGYGIGLEYPITQHSAVAVEYKTYAMTSKNRSDYDVTIAGIKFKYLF